MFESIEASFTRQNKILKVSTFLSVLIVLVLSLHLYTARQFFVHDNSDSFRNELTVEEVCYEVFNRIDNGSVSSSMISKSLKRGLEKTGFRLKALKIYPPLVFDSKNICKVVVRDKKGLRAFNAEYKKSLDYDFGLIIEDITELKVDQGDKVFR